MTSLYDIKEKLRKIPREKPPSFPLLPPHEDVNHPPPAEMKYTWGAADLVQDFTTRWHVRGELLSN
jgi:hypothetical protein